MGKQKYSLPNDIVQSLSVISFNNKKYSLLDKRYIVLNFLKAPAKRLTVSKITGS